MEAMHMRRFIVAVPLLTVLAVAGCTGGPTGADGGATPSGSGSVPAQTRTVTERPSATVTGKAPAPATSTPAARTPAPATTTAPPPPDIAPQGQAGTCLTTAAQPLLREGSSGPAVQKAQCSLNLALTGAPIPEDGDFGPVTDEATRRFQGCAGLTVDGVIGPQTWPELIFRADTGTPVC
ncbi:hypothetical protein N566_05860 [Streptomycetaceae bacterium MP113-05]|nr:hypothetical protein N566_05860 [Streptomycetaceae bacterium MP113-05]